MTTNPEPKCGIQECAYHDSANPHTCDYLWKPVIQELVRRHVSRAFELGCGTGAFASHLAVRGIDVTGVDPSKSGVTIANNAHPGLRIEVGSSHEDLRSRFGTFPAVISLEVVEHVYYPRRFARCIADLLEPRGVALITTPYHGYWKNLLMAITGRMDAHFTALWDDGHIKFWSRKSLKILLEEQCLKVIDIKGLGRIPTLSKAMLAIAVKIPQ